MRKGAENAVFDLVQDNGITSGKNCCRIVSKAGAGLTTMNMVGDKLKNWGDFDYFAMDVYTERQEKLLIAFELWDTASTNFHTRCTFEDGDDAQQTHVGKNTLMWRINRAARNGKKSGLSWEELQEKDKIQLNALKQIKFMFSPFPQGGDTTIWVDNLRLMQEDAVGGSIKIKFRRYFQNYRVEGTGADELALLPWTKIRFEAGLTWAYWFWRQIPAGWWRDLLPIHRCCGPRRRYCCCKRSRIAVNGSNRGIRVGYIEATEI